MHGFKSSAKRSSQKLANGGRVRGPGTGTSDSIDTEIPEGSYIMPADSTEQIGEGALAGMGKDVPVNLSNGEYQLPPEQVHAVGVQALDQAKNATHTPVAEGTAAQGMGFKPELFFANGGVVEDDPLKMVRRGMNTVAPGAGYVNGDLLGGAAKTAIGSVAAPFAAVIDAGYDIRNSLLDADPSSSTGGNGKFMSAAVDTVKQGASQFGEGVDTAKATIRNDLGLQKAAPKPQVQQPASAQPATAQTPAVQPSAAPAAVSAPATNTAVSPAAQPQPTATADPATTGQAAPLANNVIRDGNSFSGSNISAGFTVNGQRPAMGGGARSPQNQAAVDALFARTPDLGSVPNQVQPASGAPAGFAPRGGMTVIRDSSAGDRDRQRLMSAASTPHAGAQNGQLTAAQLGILRSVQEGDQRTDLTMATTDANNAARLAEAQMSTTSADRRTALTEQGANRRADASNQLDERRFNSEQEARGFQTRAAQRQERLYQQYDNAKPEERAAIAAQIQQLTGKQAPNKFTVVPGGQEIDQNTQQLVTRPAQVFDNQTGQFVQQQSSGAARAPQIGEQRGQYKFKGGNPADQSNWEKI